MPAATATAAAPLAVAEPTSTPRSAARLQPVASRPAYAGDACSGGATSTPVTVTITLANPSDAQVPVA